MTDASVLVTGATGLIGGMLMRALSGANEKHGLRLRIIGCGRNAAKGEALCRACGAPFIAGDIREPLPAKDLPPALDYIFHCAAMTQSADMAARPVDVMTTSADGTRNMLELARARSCRSFVYLSSMEVYGRTKLHEVSEKDMGYIDPASPRSAYPESKRFCEMLCTAYAAQYGLPVKIARLAQTFGAGTPRGDARVFAQFARSALNAEDIVLHTEGKSLGNCCSTSDAALGLLLLLLKGKNGEAYNIANPDASMTIRETAESVANEVCGGKVKVVVDVPEDIQKRGYAPDVRHRLNADKLKALGWEPRYGLVDMYKRMIADRRERER
jgi:nucleoside-diphosphate-sugar epimerase